jgi:hypothetical protein
MRRVVKSPILWLVFAFFTAPVVWMVFQQSGGTLVYFHCRQTPLVGPILAAAALALDIGAGRVAWRLAGHPSTSATQRFLAWLSVGFAAIFGLGVVIMAAAMVLVPPCAR